ncbi:MAG: DUF1294 domain-containing protein [Defluviitaleaceae bacterium]|nr:DUF1294 domain-containing protein [Defluviitaleaceae bacterium]
MSYIIRLFFSIDFALIFTLSLIFWNIFVFVLYGIDKRLAIKNKHRIKEKILIFCSLIFGGIGTFFATILFNHKKRKIIFKIIIPISVFLTLIPTIHIIHSYILDRIIVYREKTFFDSQWSSELDGYRIAFMTDFHTISEESMNNVVRELNNRNIDLLVLGGDFSLRDNHYRTILNIISNIETTDGIFGVEGNHDNAERLFLVKSEYGIGILDNSGLYIHPNFFLAGVHDLWNRNPNISVATSNANNDSFILLVSHNPDVSMIQDTSHLNLILSGHIHGGQITFFGWPFYLFRGSITSFGTRFASRFSESYDGIPVYTSFGVGEYYSVPRVFARPEVVIFTMYNKN